jgi:tetratricopeptide (TPR) repeat protein
VSFITRAWQIFACQASFLGGHGYWANCQAAGRSVLAAARAASDHTALGWTHATLGWYGTFTGAHDEGRAHQRQALEHFRHAGDVHGQAWAHLFASLAYSWKGGDSAQAVTHSAQALALFRQVGDQAGERWALLGLGNGHAYLGNYERARGYARQALGLGP